MIAIRPIEASLRPQVAELIAREWGSPVMVSRGNAHRADELPGYVAVDSDDIVGLVTYAYSNAGCEIVTLDSWRECQGIGTLLVRAVVDEATRSKRKRVWLVTTNDNTPAIRFYQKRGFRMCALHVDAVREARAIKPQIPLIGLNGIPIDHEIEFERIVSI
ncbi:GNAT family N-acetyltransferase [Paenibacillus flagellatus]|uniref:GNAT family N-acetyltransferase n=1 Tax=Paenibacillus flagellatus TaxID=2211139 RepID=A0A2V5K5G7_9BACL|nr:GNAT family N-acetyltransferase [Paenibacillus flagellatus]PYI54629.1 GNAT family N-acetyltransferase [Paenibacillus flagellatus]